MLPECTPHQVDNEGLCTSTQICKIDSIKENCPIFCGLCTPKVPECTEDQVDNEGLCVDPAVCDFDAEILGDGLVISQFCPVLCGICRLTTQELVPTTDTISTVLSTQGFSSSSTVSTSTTSITTATTTNTTSTTQSTQTTALVSATSSTTTLPLCSDVVDNTGFCTSTSLCNHPILAFLANELCRKLCGLCKEDRIETITTTSKTSTSTSTAEVVGSTTRDLKSTNQPSCVDALEPGLCTDAKKCEGLLAAAFQTLCPVMCGTCPTTKTQAPTTEPLYTPGSCGPKGPVDAVRCGTGALIVSACDELPELSIFCPKMCDSCPSTSNEVTTTESTTTSEIDVETTTTSNSVSTTVTNLIRTKTASSTTVFGIGDVPDCTSNHVDNEGLCTSEQICNIEGVKNNCPILCGLCNVKVPECSREQVDDTDVCDDASLCDDPFLGKSVFQVLCPVLCDICTPPTTASSSTEATAHTNAPMITESTKTTRTVTKVTSTISTVTLTTTTLITSTTSQTISSTATSQTNTETSLSSTSRTETTTTPVGACYDVDTEACSNPADCEDPDTGGLFLLFCPIMCGIGKKAGCVNMTVTRSTATETSSTLTATIPITASTITSGTTTTATTMDPCRDVQYICDISRERCNDVTFGSVFQEMCPVLCNTAPPECNLTTTTSTISDTTSATVTQSTKTRSTFVCADDSNGVCENPEHCNDRAGLGEVIQQLCPVMCGKCTETFTSTVPTSVTKTSVTSSAGDDQNDDVFANSGSGSDTYIDITESSLTSLTTTVARTTSPDVTLPAASSQPELTTSLEHEITTSAPATTANGSTVDDTVISTVVSVNATAIASDTTGAPTLTSKLIPIGTIPGIETTTVFDGDHLTVMTVFLTESALVGASVIPVASAAGVGISAATPGRVQLGDIAVIGPDTQAEELRTIVGFGSLILDRPLSNEHPIGTAVRVLRAPTPGPAATTHVAFVSPGPQQKVQQKEGTKNETGDLFKLLTTVLGAAALVSEVAILYSPAQEFRYFLN